MIVPMKKIVLLFKNGDVSEAEAAVEKLRDFGAFHFGLSEESTSDLEQMEEALTILRQQGAKEAEEFGSREYNADYYTAKTLQLRGELNSIKSEVTQLESIRAWYDAWGSVCLADVRELAKRGFYLSLYEVAHGDVAALNLNERRDVYRVGTDAKMTRLALLARDEDAVIPDATRIQFPEWELSDVIATEARLHERETEIRATLAQIAGYQHVISREIAEEKYRIQFNAVKSYINAVEEIPNVHYISGYVPVDTVDAFKKLATAEHWGYTIDDPSLEDTPPTLLKNSKWVEPVYMLYRFLGLRIGYREMDVSAVFMFFYALITGLLVADAGYGLLYFLLVGAAHWKLKGEVDPRYFQLGYMLSAAIIAGGVVTGVYFGSVTIAGLPGIRELTIPAIAAFDLQAQKMSNSIEAMMQVGFFIGIVHLGLAHVMKGWQQRNSLVWLGHVGYIAFLYSVYKVICFLIFKEPLPDYLAPLMVGGIVMIFVFINSDQGILKGIKSLATTFVFDLIGGFSDMISYIRIPIVGLVTVVLGSLFNLLFVAAPLGHVFGMILALMGVLIHATRLKSMEFSNHAGMEWNGEWYKPFAGKEKKQWI